MLLFFGGHIIHVTFKKQTEWLPKEKRADLFNIIVKHVLQDLAFNIFDMI